MQFQRKLQDLRRPPGNFPSIKRQFAEGNLRFDWGRRSLLVLSSCCLDITRRHLSGYRSDSRWQFRNLHDDERSAGWCDDGLRDWRALQRTMGGDVYCYLHEANPYPFTPEQVKAVNAFGFEHVMCKNSNIEFLTALWWVLKTRNSTASICWTSMLPHGRLDCSPASSSNNEKSLIRPQTLMERFIAIYFN